MAKNKMTVTIRGPALVNADKNMLKAVKKALITVGKIGTREVRQNTPVASGLSAGWSPKAGKDVVYAHFIETGKRYPGGRQTRYRGSRMFGKAAAVLAGKLKKGSKFEKEIVGIMNGKKAA